LGGNWQALKGWHGDTRGQHTETARCPKDPRFSDPAAEIRKIPLIAYILLGPKL